MIDASSHTQGWRPATYYPDPAIKALDPRFEKYWLKLSAVERLATGLRWAEGPVWFGDGRYLLCSDIPNQRIIKWEEETGTVSVFRKPSNFANGNTRDRQGRLVTCEHGGRRVVRTEYDGSITVLMDSFGGKPLNSPNDVVVKSDGSIWFTDPTYGIDSDYEGFAAPSEIGASNVYRIDPADGSLTMVASDRIKPNGLAFSPDENTLYISDTGRSHVPGLAPTITAYPVNADKRSLGEGRVFATCDVGMFDGFRVDRHGNIFASSGDSVRVYAPDGTLIGRILVPEVVSNVCFGGPKRNRLYITGTTSLYAIYVNSGPAEPTMRLR